jgi:hypothetical protein
MFLASATALLPFVASDLHARWALGLMYAATSIGALIAALLGGWASRVRRYGRAIAVSGGAWGLATLAFGLTHTIALAIVTLIITGAADMYSGMFRDSLWNRTIPDHLRGRVAGIELLSYGLGPSGGQLRAGAVASLTNVRAAIWSGQADFCASPRWVASTPSCPTSHASPTRSTTRPNEPKPRTSCRDAPSHLTQPPARPDWHNPRKPIVSDDSQRRSKRARKPPPGSATRRQKTGPRSASVVGQTDRADLSRTRTTISCA